MAGVYPSLSKLSPPKPRAKHAQDVGKSAGCHVRLSTCCLAAPGRQLPKAIRIVIMGKPLVFLCLYYMRQTIPLAKLEAAWHAADV